MGAVLPRAVDAGNLGDAGGWIYDESSRRVIVRLPGRQGAQTVRIER